MPMLILKLCTYHAKRMDRIGFPHPSTCTTSDASKATRNTASSGERAEATETPQRKITSRIRMPTPVSTIIKFDGSHVARNRGQDGVMNQANNCNISEAGLEASIACESRGIIGTGVGTISKPSRGISMHETTAKRTTSQRVICDSTPRACAGRGVPKLQPYGLVCFTEFLPYASNERNSFIATHEHATVTYNIHGHPPHLLCFNYAFGGFHSK